MSQKSVEKIDKAMKYQAVEEMERRAHFQLLAQAAIAIAPSLVERSNGDPIINADMAVKHAKYLVARLEKEKHESA